MVRACARIGDAVIALVRSQGRKPVLVFHDRIERVEGTKTACVAIIDDRTSFREKSGQEARSGVS